MHRWFVSSRTSLKRIVTTILMTVLMLGISLPAAAQPGDITGTWAEQQLNSWIDKGLVRGYPDGTFKPDANVTRAEFVVMTNRAFGFSATAPTQYIDVTGNDWFAQDIAKAKAAGYVSGYPDSTFQPNANISREEAAAILSNLKNLSVPSEEVLSRFSDSGQIPAWSRGAISAVVSSGLMNGYPDQTFKAENSITRAEAVVTLNNAMQEQVKPPTTVVYDKAGKYGPASGSETVAGNVIISVSGVTLQNTTISGDLILAEGIGSGDVNLKNVIVKGETFVKGGGSNSVVMTGCTFGKITVTKAGVRIAMYGNTTFEMIVLDSSATLELDSTADFDSEVLVSKNVQAGSIVRMSGNIDKVMVEAEKIEIYISSGTISELEVGDTANGSKIDLTEGVRVVRLVINAPADVSGGGEIETAVVMVEGVSFEQEPLNIENPNDVLISIAGEEKKGTGTGGGVAPLNLVFSDPANGSTNVPVDLFMTFTFDRGVVRDYWDINQGCFSMEDGDNNPVSINVSRADNYLDDTEKRNIYVTPSGDLDYSTTYTVTIDGGLTANNGNTMGEDETVSFTTEEDNGGGGGGGGGDLSTAQAALAVAGSKTAGTAFNLSITGAKNSSGYNLIGDKWVTVISNLDGQVFNDDVRFSGGTATVAIPVGEVITAGTNTLTIYIEEVTPEPTVAVTVTAATQISSPNSDVDIDAALAKGSTSTVTITLRDAYNNVMAGQTKSYKIVTTVTDNDATTDESYTVDGTLVTGTSILSRSGAFDGNGQRSFTVVLPGSIDAGDGIAIQVTQNNDTLIGSSFSYIATADLSNANVDLAAAGNKTAGASFGLNITGAKDIEGTDLIGTKTVTVNSNLDGQVFSADVNFAAGSASVTIAAGEVTTAGTNTLTVTIAGVTPHPSVAVTVVAATQISSANSDVDIDTALDAGSTSTFTITIRDAYNNVMANQSKSYKIVAMVTDNDAATDESYTVDGTPVTSTSTLSRSGAFDSNGQRGFTVILPGSIDTGDGIAIQVSQNNDTLIGSSFSFIESASDFSAAEVALAAAGNKTAGTSFALSITGAKDMAGTDLTGTKTVTVNSDLDGQVFSADVTFAAGAASVTIAAGEMTTAGTNILTVTIAGVTPHPSVAVTVVASTQISSANSDVDIDTALAKGNTSTITITLRDAYNNVMAGQTKNYKIVATITNNDATTTESYTVDGSAVTSTTTLTRSGLFDSNGQRSFTVTLPAAIDSGDEISIQVTQNNDSPIGGSFTYTEETVDLSDAGASLAVAGPKTAGTTFNLNITGAQDADGVNLSGAINVTVTSDLNGEVFSGNVTFTGGAGTVTIPIDQVVTAGTNTLTISIAGVTPEPEVVVTVTAATQIDSTNSDVDIDTALDKGSESIITITLRDVYNNLITNLSKNYKIVVTITNNNAATPESYTVDGSVVTGSTSLSRSGTFDSNGQRSFSVILPASIDSGDGISIQVTLNNGTLLGENFDYLEP